MKKIVTIILISISILINPIFVNASGGISPNTNSLNMNVGNSKTFTVTATNAVGRIDISSSNTSVATVSIATKWLDNDSVTVTVTGLTVGTSVINVRLTDAATYDEEELNNSYSISVNVVESSNNKPINQSPNNNDNSSSRGSIDNSLKSLTIKGFNLVKVDENNYMLSVSNSTSSVEIECSANDDKAVVSGAGVKNLNVGDNVFVIVITSESGSKNIINIKVSRNEKATLDDLNSLLNSSSNNIDVAISKGTLITTDYLLAIKNSQKKVTFDYKDEEGRILYSWNIDGASIKNTDGFDTTLEFISPNAEDISLSSNYSDGMYLHFLHSGLLPENTNIKVYVGDKYKNEDELNIYYYNSETKKLELISRKSTVSDGYIEFAIEHCSDYFITRANIGSKKTNNVQIYLGIIALETVVIIAFIVRDSLKKNKG